MDLVATVGVEALIEALISTTALRSLKCHLKSIVGSQSTHHCSTIANSQWSRRHGTGQHQGELTTLDGTAKCISFKTIWPDSVAYNIIPTRFPDQ